MARDKAACVARQAAMSRQGAGLGSRRAQGRAGLAGRRMGAGLGVRGALGWLWQAGRARQAGTGGQ